MRLLLCAIIFIVVAMISVTGADPNNAKSGPHLIVSSINGTLEMDRPGTIWFDFKNDANISAADRNLSGDRQLPKWLQSAYGINISDAIGVSAKLIPRDARFEMLTGPQIVGSLKSGKNRTALFNLRTNGLAEPGSYPADILVTYRMLSDIMTSGDPDQPDITFRYENASETIPTDVNVVQGPKISVEEVKNSLTTGTESELNLVFANSGDLPASDLRAKALSASPFGYAGGPDFIGSLDPGHSASAKFMIKTENGTAPGIYALQMSIDYRDGKILRTEEIAALVPVDVQSNKLYMLAIAVVAVVLVSTAYIVIMKYRKRFRIKRNGRWR